jgi:hypothetical protein
MLVDFMLIGAQKGGTTSLAYQLAQHPQIHFCKHKEPDYFSKSPEWAANINDYHQLYNFSPGKIYGEASTTYTWIPEYPDTALRLKAYNPNLKFIYLMRQPVDRTISHYNHELLRARTKYPKEREVFEVPIYINHSRYALQIRPYLELFPRENILLLVFEEYIKDPLQTLYRIADHLEIDAHRFDGIDLSPQNKTMERTGERRIKRWLTPIARLFPLRVRNSLRRPFVYKIGSKIEFPIETKRLLWRFLEDDVEAIARIMGRSLNIWRHNSYSNG